MRHLKYISDLHLEKIKGSKSHHFPKFPKSNTSEPLFICGDLGNPFHKNYKSFLKNTSYKFNKIFLITGNHEYYHRDMKRVLDVDNKITDIVSDISNISFLNQTCEEFNGYKIFGTTLWADGFKYYNDENNKHNKHNAHMREFGKFAYKRHTDDVRWLENNISNKINE